MANRQVAVILLVAASLCGGAGSETVDTSHLPDRWFITPDVWANPWENWQLRDGAIITTHPSPNRAMTLQHLTLELSDADASASLRVVLHPTGDAGEGAAGFALGIRVNDPVDDYRSRLLFGEGLYTGISTKGELFIGRDTRGALAVPEGWDFAHAPVQLAVDIEPELGGSFSIELTALDAKTGAELGRVEKKGVPAARLVGNVALVACMPKWISSCEENARWRFTDWQLDGAKFRHVPQRTFGPILWSQYTLSEGVLKLTVQMAPVNAGDSQPVLLQFQRDGEWETAATAPIHDLSWTAPFRIAGWDDTRDTRYRLAWTQVFTDGTQHTYYWEGTIRRDPEDNDRISCAIFCCFMDYLFPNRCIEQNVTRQNPDILMFVGDQIYEPVGGWGILRTGPIDRMCVNYLRKLALWGWSFRDLMKNRPTVTMPDDHDVYHGNLWGDAGRQITLEEWKQPSGYGTSQNVGSVGGYVQPIEFVQAVERTQTSHLPDPACTKTFKQGLGAYFTAMTYGGIGFAILEDRKFKTGPLQIAHRHNGPRPDHISEPAMAGLVNDPDAKMLGDDQLAFLHEWAGDWRGQAMKAAISQTVYCGVATHHGDFDNFLLGDMDSGGWPQAGRDKAVDALRRAGAVLLAGDQHLPTVVRHGILQPGDGIVSFVTPAGATGYQRWWLPEDSGIQRIAGGPHDGRLNTGLYRDGFGNIIDVLAVGNPPAKPDDASRETLGATKSAGWGLVVFDKPLGAIEMQAWRVRPGLNAVAFPRRDDQFPGWPVTIQASENYGVSAPKLPPVTLEGDMAARVPRPVIRVTDTDGRLVSAGRMTGASFIPTVYTRGAYTVEVLSGDDCKTVIERFTGIEPAAGPPLRVGR
ncbi:MAG: alkaline phosphatase D family protein [Candidatus Hydrogenedentes bacterium]|nr:alkaline phosphatase D family protein [Candidatus Hydrogenedentota bacterium]